MHDRRRLTAGWFGALGRFGLQRVCLFFFLAGCAFAADLRRRRGRLNLRGRHAHHLIGDAIRFMLKRIVGLSDHELSLNDTWLRR